MAECLARLVMAFPFGELLNAMALHIKTLHNMNEESCYDKRAHVVSRVSHLPHFSVNNALM